MKTHFFSPLTSYTKSSLNSSSDNMKVMIRIRPPLNREIEQGTPFRSIAEVNEKNNSISLIEYLGAEVTESERQRELLTNPSLFQMHRFTFDFVFNMTSTQEFVYQAAAKSSVSSVLEGYNSTILAYGQTGTGKTHTMEGFTFNPNDPERGIIPRTIEDIFQYIEGYSTINTKFIIRASYLQLYNEYISDLLKPNSTAKNLQIREDKKKGIYVDMLSEWVVRTPSDIYALLQRGASCRATASTFMNDVSSRSHAVFVITVEQMTSLDNDGSTHTKIGKLNLVDLAGSERIGVTGATGKQLEESKKINKSLSALGNVINALTDPKGTNHIPYRDSKLTRLLEDSLGGNCKTTMITMISPCQDFFSESLSSLLFSKRAKNIKNRPVINEDRNQRALISQYEAQLKNLRIELEEKNRLLLSNEHVIQLEAEKKRAEEDKREVMKALETASKQYNIEKEEKKKLEMRIQMMNSQMITGGGGCNGNGSDVHNKIEETPQFRSALEERQSQLLKELGTKLQEFEEEKSQLEEDKVEGDKYKELLMKQKDIMIALTTKLNERDEIIVQLQEEMEVYDKLNHQQEHLLEMRYNRIKNIEAICKSNHIELPLFNDSKMSLSKTHPESKIYLSYEAERNLNEFDNFPMTMLSAEEKIKELKGIVKEQEAEINILKLVSQKFISGSEAQEEEGSGNCDSNRDIDAYVGKMGNEFELHERIRDLNEERQLLMKREEKLNEVINSQKAENEALLEQNSLLSNGIGKAERENSNYIEQNKVLCNSIKSMMQSIDNNVHYNMLNVKGELAQLWKLALGGNDNSDKLTKHPSLSLMSYSKSQPNKENRFGYVQGPKGNYHQQLFINDTLINHSHSKSITNSNINTDANNNNITTQPAFAHSDKFISKFINSGR